MFINKYFILRNSSFFKNFSVTRYKNLWISKILYLKQKNPALLMKYFLIIFIYWIDILLRVNCHNLKQIWMRNMKIIHKKLNISISPNWYSSLLFGIEINCLWHQFCYFSDTSCIVQVKKNSKNPKLNFFRTFFPMQVSLGNKKIGPFTKTFLIKW